MPILNSIKLILPANATILVGKETIKGKDCGARVEQSSILEHLAAPLGFKHSCK